MRLDLAFQQMEETIVAPGAATETAPASAVIENPTVAESETELAQQKPEDTPKREEEDPSAKAIRNLQRRVDRKHAQAAEAEARARIAEQRLAEFEARANGAASEDQPQVDPVKLAAHMAQELRTVERTMDRVKQVQDVGKKLDGWDQAVNAVAESAPFFTPQNHPTPFLAAVLDADNPAALLHYLGQNTELVDDLRGLTEAQIGRRVAKLEAQMEREQAEAKAAKQSKAPTPVTPVRQNADPGGLSDQLSPEEWARRFYKMRRGG